MEALRHGNCILVLGPEIPAKLVTNPPDPQPDETTPMIEGLRTELISELEEDPGRHVSGHTLAAVAQQYEDVKEFGPGALRAAAESFYRSKHYVPSTVHRQLASLPFPLIVTTCQDDLLTQALQEAKKLPDTQRYHLRGDKRENPEFLISGSPDKPLIYHLFGDANEPASLVLSENDVLDFLINVVSGRPPLPNSLLSALKRKGKSFLFLGFGVRHWHLRILLKVLLRNWEQGDSTPVAAEPMRDLLESDCNEVVLFYQRGMRVDLADFDIGAFLTELSNRLQAEGGYAGEAESFGSRPRVFISYAREDADIATKLFNALQRKSFDPWLDNENLVGGEDWDKHIRQDLERSDFTLLLYSKTLCGKRDSYVNKELALATERALSVRGSFLIPLRTDDITPEERIFELGKYNEMDLRPESFDEDLSKVISTMKREYQLRNR